MTDFEKPRIKLKIDNLKNQNFNPEEAWKSPIDVHQSESHIYFTGVTATATDPQQVLPEGVYLQTVFIFEKIKSQLLKLDCDISNLKNCTVYLKNTQDIDEFGSAFNDLFHHQIETIVLIEKKLSSPEALIQIDACAQNESPSKHSTSDHIKNKASTNASI